MCTRCFKQKKTVMKLMGLNYLYSCMLSRLKERKEWKPRFNE